MIHADVTEMKAIKRLDSRGINGVRAYAKPVEDGGRSFLVLLIEYPKERMGGLIDDLHYKR